MRGGGARIAVVLVVVLIGLALSAALVALGVSRTRDDAPRAEPDEVTLSGNPDGPLALVVGDSVTFLSGGAIAREMGDELRLDVRGRPGYKTDELLPTLRNGIEAGPPEILVLLPGYNDIWTETDPEPALTQMADLAAEVPCVVWMLLPTKGPWDPALARAYNDRVEELAAERPSIQVDGAWRDAVDDTAGPAPSTELIEPDQVHPIEAGQQRLAEVMAAAVERRCR